MAKSRWNCSYTDDSRKLYGPARGRHFDSWDIVQKSIYIRWVHMMDRCYDPLLRDFQWYGALGIYVSPCLRVFSNYDRVVRSLPNFSSMENSLIGKSSTLYEIDKDLNGGKIYSPLTIKIVTKLDNFNEMYSRCGNSMRNGGAVTQGNPCYALDSLGNRTEASGYRDLSRKLLGDEICAPLIKMTLDGEHPTIPNRKTRGRLSGYEIWRVGDGPRPYF